MTVDRFCAFAILAGIGLAACGTEPPPQAPDVWMGDLLRDGYRITSETPFRQNTQYGVKRYRYQVGNGDKSWACYALDSAADREAVTDRRCLPYDPATEADAK